MKWITRQRIQVNRTATCWLIRRFIDPDAEASVFVVALDYFPSLTSRHGPKQFPGVLALDLFAYLAHVLLHKSWLGWQSIGCIIRKRRLMSQQAFGSIPAKPFGGYSGN
jgi:Chromate resistance exported protein